MTRNEDTSGVQALSAAPAVNTISLLALGAELRKTPVCFGGPEIWALFREGSMMRYLDNFENCFVDSALLAASPTPPAEQQAAPKAARGEPAPELQRMTASRAAYFMERFLREEKLLGPNEQAAVQFALNMLEAAPQQEAQDVSDCALNLCDPDGPHEHGCYLASPAGAAAGEPSDAEMDAMRGLSVDVQAWRTRAAPQQEAQEPAHPACKSDMLVNGGALVLAIAVLRRAGKTEVADELAKTAQPAPLSDDVVRDVRKALDRAFVMGQNYWADADSESYTANKRSDVTRLKFNTLRDEMCAALAAQGGKV